MLKILQERRIVRKDSVDVVIRVDMLEADKDVVNEFVVEAAKLCAGKGRVVYRQSDNVVEVCYTAGNLPEALKVSSRLRRLLDRYNNKDDEPLVETEYGGQML